LYNDNQVEKLVRKVAEKLEVGTSVITAALTDLTDLLEQYRLEQIEKQGVQHDKRKILSEEEQQQARLYLSAPNLIPDGKNKRRYWQSRSDRRSKQQAVNVFNLHEPEERKPFTCYQSRKQRHRQNPFTGESKRTDTGRRQAGKHEPDGSCDLLFWKV
jgi:hypothetical protein